MRHQKTAIAVIFFSLFSSQAHQIITSIQSAHDKQKIARSIGTADIIYNDLKTQCLNDLAAANAVPRDTRKHCALHNHQDDNYNNDCLLSLCITGVIEQYKKAEEIKVGDHIIGIASSGLHTDGYKVVNETIDSLNIDISGWSPFITHHATFAQALLEPSISYQVALHTLYSKGIIKAASHVAGAGLKHKLETLLPKDFGIQLHWDNWYIPPIFRWIKEASNLSDEDMFEKFNCGLGVVVIASERYSQSIIEQLQAAGHYAYDLGIITKQTFGSVQINGAIRSSRIRIMLVGDSAIEHALAWKFAQSPYVELVCVTPGNGGTATEHKVTNLPINPAHYGALIAYTKRNSMDLLIVGPDNPLAPTIVTQCKQKGIRCLGPTQQAAEKLNKLGKKEYMAQYSIPCSTPYLEENSENTTVEIALMIAPASHHHLLTVQIEHKDAGVLSPAPFIGDPQRAGIEKIFINPIMRAFDTVGIDYTGFLTIKLIQTKKGEFFLSTVRFGLSQWTSQAIAMKLKSDLFALCDAACKRKLDQIAVDIDQRPTLSVSLETEGNIPTEHVIVGIPENKNNTALLFHNSTSRQQNNSVTTGKNVLSSIGIGDTVQAARNNAYNLISQIFWPGISYRKDIGYATIAQQKNI